MKKLLTFILIIFSISCAKHPDEDFNPLALFPKEIEASEEFVQGSEDIPLASGMEKNSDDAIGFDSSSGSVVSSSYNSKFSSKEVKDFYIKTLPQMGWEIVKNLEDKVAFKREKENLEIEFTSEDEQNIVTFYISSSL